MSKPALHQRASALENEFFHRVDQELIVRFQEQHQLEVDEDALAIATGIADRQLLDELLSAEITPKTLVALSVFPAIFVAWSDGHVESKERDAVLKAMHQLGVTDSSPAGQLISEWLRHKPAAELFDVWAEFIHAIQPTLSQEAFEQLRKAAMGRAEEIAAAAGGFMGLKAISKVERAALQKLDDVWQTAIDGDSHLSV